MLYWQYVLPGFIGETVPFLDCGPFWTIMVAASILKKRSEAGDAVGMLAGVAASAVMPQGNIEGAAGAVAGAGAALGQNLATPSLPAAQAGENPSDEPAVRAPALQFSKNMNSDIKPAQKSTANDNERTARPANDTLIDAGSGRTAYAA
jgi:hypothetical protein